jgi:hypothetical protein
MLLLLLCQPGLARNRFQVWTTLGPTHASLRSQLRS